MARIAYGNRNNIPAAIANNTIPKDTIIITKDDPKDADLLFYDSDANVKSIVTKVRFGSREAAIAFIAENDMIGQTICFPEDDNFKAYIVQSDLSLTEIGSTGVGHTHANKTLLDLITQEKFDKWDNPQGAAIATDEVCGIVKSSTDENKVSVSSEGIMSVNSLNINKLVQDDGDEIVLSCGSSSGEL